MPRSSTPSDPADIEILVHQTLVAHRMLAPQDRVLVGVSGGPDSMALLFLLHRLQAQFRIRIGVAHLNHGLRGAPARRDAAMVQRAATALALPCHMGAARVDKVKTKLGISLEAAGRRVRYAFYNKVMIDEGYDKLALGHHLDDNAEQVLLALLRGCGPRGLSGIAPVRDERIIRPLLRVRRTQIEAFVRQNGIATVSDETNQDLTFLRNRIRHRLLPHLAAEYSPQISDRLTRLAEITRSEEDWIDSVVTTAYASAVCDRRARTLSLSVDRLRSAHPALARRLIRRALMDLTGSVQRFTFAHIQSVLHLSVADAGEKHLHLPRGIRVRRTGRRLMLRATGRRGRDTLNASRPGPFPSTIVPLPLPPEMPLAPMGIGLRFSCHAPPRLPAWSAVGPDQIHLDWDRLSFPLLIRPPAPGDRFTPLGSTGAQKIKKFFIDHKIPRGMRREIPILADQRRILWVVGQRMNEHVKITDETEKVLSIEFFLLDSG